MTKWMLEALELARMAERIDEVPIGAVVVKDGKVIGRGFNRKETLCDPTSHAEMEAIREATKNLANWHLDGCEIYVTLEPCPMCLSAMMLSRIKAVHYGAKDPKGGAISLAFNLNDHPQLNHRFETHYIEAPEAGEILTRFFKNKRLQKKA